MTATGLAYWNAADQIGVVSAQLGALQPSPYGYQSSYAKRLAANRCGDEASVILQEGTALSGNYAVLAGQIGTSVTASAFAMKNYYWVFACGNRATGAIADRPARSVGTCFAIDPEGTILTSQHVIDGASSVRVRLANAIEAPAIITEASAATDLAILKIEVPTPNFLPLRSARSVEVGDEVFTIGFPVEQILGSEPKFSEGSISSLSGIKDDASLFQVSIPASPGNSGGPVVSMSGEVVGVVASGPSVEHFYQTSGALPQNVTWAVKADYAVALLGQAHLQTPATTRREAISRAQAAICRVEASRQ